MIPHCSHCVKIVLSFFLRLTNGITFKKVGFLKKRLAVENICMWGCCVYLLCSLHSDSLVKLFHRAIICTFRKKTHRFKNGSYQNMCFLISTHSVQMFNCLLSPPSFLFCNNCFCYGRYIHQ